MFLLVYVRKELVKHIDTKSVDAVTIGTGLLNRMVSVNAWLSVLALIRIRSFIGKQRRRGHSIQVV